MEQKIIAVVAGREIKESDFEKFLQNVCCRSGVCGRSSPGNTI